MQAQHSPQSSFFGMIYDTLVPPEHSACDAESDGFVGPLNPHTCDVTADKGSASSARSVRHQRQPQTTEDQRPMPGTILKQSRTNTQVLGQANPRSQRERHNIERKFAEQKEYHGLKQARYWVLAKVTIQVMMTRLSGAI